MNWTGFIYRPGPSERCSIGDRDLHCGDCFQLKMPAGVIDVRIELSDDWVLVGASPSDAYRYDGVSARFYPA